MASAVNQLKGLYGNQGFMDHLYRYGEMNSEIESKTKEEITAANEQEIVKCRQKSAIHRVTSLNICLSEIKSTTPHTDEWKTYFDYVRWNHKVISDELNFYMRHPCLEKYSANISVSSQQMNYILMEFCSFTRDDRTIINDYQHIFDMISSKEKPEKVLLQAGNLFVNFINILTNRYYYEETADIKFADVEMQAGVIIDKLSSNQLEADKVKKAYEDFIEVREMQDVRRGIQNSLIKAGVKLAHAMASESFLQTCKRLIDNSISEIKRRLHIALRTAIGVGKAMVHPILHPIQTGKAAISVLSSPVQSTKALITWARLNPWKCCALVVGGLCLGAVGAVVAAGTSLAVATLAFEYTVAFDGICSILIPGIMIGSFGGVALGGFGVVAHQANEMISNAETDKMKLIEKLKSYENIVNKNGEKIASHALGEENSEWWTLLDESNALIQAQTQQIEAMNVDQLQQAEREHNDRLSGIDSGLKDANRLIDEGTVEMLSDQKDELILQRAEEIRKKRISRMAAFSGNI